MRTCTVIPLGDLALTLDFEGHTDEPRELIRCLADHLREQPLPAITGVVPAIRSLTVHYDPALITWERLKLELHHVVDGLTITPVGPRSPVVIPVCYGGEFGPDLALVAGLHDTTAEAIVASHAAGSYSVAMIGFLPGFPYLDGLAPALHTPRRTTPRTLVPAGSVGIGGSSTGVYPFSSPGGWHLIGRTPLRLFDPMRSPPALLQPGDQVRFVPISAKEHARLTEMG